MIDSADPLWLAEVVVDAATDAGIGIAVTVTRPEPRHLFVSEGMAALFGYGHDEFVALDPFAIFSGVDLQRVEELAQRHAESGDALPALCANARRKDGSIVSFDASITSMSHDATPMLVSFAVDTSRRRLVEESLAASEDRLMRVLDRLPDPAFAARGGSVVYANRALRELLAISEEASASSEIPGDLVHVRGSESWPTDDELVLGRRTEVTLSAVSGRQVTLEARATRAHFRGVPVELWFCRDLTAQKQIEARLMQADRLATLGTLAGGLAHAINNPLSSMVLNLEDLVRRMPELTEHPEHADDIKERLSLAKEAADRVARVVSQLRVFARMRHASDVEDVDVRRVVEDGIELVANEIRHRGQLKLALHPVPPVRGVEGRIEQALLTLLILAVRMLPDRPGRHSRLVVETGMDDGRVAVTVRCEGASAMTSSSGDTELSGSEGPWERSIGLAICDEIVRSMEGSLEATSDGTVSTFRVSVPVPGASDVRLGRSVAQTRSAPSEHGVRAKVLVIDDDPGVLSALRVMLQDDHDVTVVQDPREAIADVLGGASYDVVFCDFVMPQMTGEDVYDALRRGRPGFEQRIVFMTGAAFQREADRFLARVDNARIDKPFNLEHVERLVRRAVR